MLGGRRLPEKTLGKSMRLNRHTHHSLPAQVWPEEPAIQNTKTLLRRCKIPALCQLRGRGQPPAGTCGDSQAETSAMTLVRVLLPTACIILHMGMSRVVEEDPMVC